MPATQDSSYGPSPPTFKRQGPRKPRRARPAPSPPSPPQAAFLAAGTRSEEPALQRSEDKGKGKARTEDPLPSPAPGPPPPTPPPPPAARKPASRPRGMHPAVVAAWLPREEANAEAGPAPHSPPAARARERLEDVPSLADGSFGVEYDGNDENVENVPPRWDATTGAALRGEDRTRPDALPPSVDAFFADVCPKTRGRLSSAAHKKHNQKLRASLSSAAAAFEDVLAPAEMKRRKRVIAPSPPPSAAPVPAPSGSWESHDLSPPPDSTVPLRYPISLAAPAPAFAGAAELAALSPRAKEALLRPPQKRPLELERPSASAFHADADPGRAGKRARARAGGEEGRGGEGAARLPRGQAAKGPFLREMCQTGFAPLARELQMQGRARLRRKVSVKELGGQLGVPGLSGTKEVKPPSTSAGRVLRPKKKGRGARPLRMGREEDAGDVLELDARAVADATRLARRLPPAHKPGIRPSARATRMRFEPVRRPAPVQAITLRPARRAARPESGADGAEGVANPVGKVNPEGGARATERAGFRFVVGVKAKRALTVAADAAGRVGEPSCAASTPTPREGATLLSREHPPTPVTASKARVGAAEGEEPPGRLLRRVSTYAGFLHRPQREEKDPLVSGVTQQLIQMHADGAAEDGVLVSEQQSDNANDEHASSHSHRGGSLPSPLAPLALPGPAPAVPGPGPAAPALLVPPTPSAATLSFPSVPPAQQPRPVVQSTASSFALSVRAALDSAGSSSAERMLHPPDLLFPVADEERAPSSSSSRGLELRLPTRTSGSGRGWSADSAWSVGPTMESEESCPSGERTEGASAGEAEGAAQDPPTSALRSSPLFAQAQRDDDEDGYFEAAEDDPFAAGDIPFTDLAVAARTRQMLRPRPRPAIARQAKPAVEENAPRLAPTPPESTKKPAGSRRRQLLSLKG